MHKSLSLVIDMAAGHIEDIQTGLEEGLYSPEDNQDLQTKEAALYAVRQLLTNSKQIEEVLQEAAGALLACLEQMSQVEKIVSDDDDAWHNARADARDAYNSIQALEDVLIPRSTPPVEDSSLEGPAPG